MDENKFNFWFPADIDIQKSGKGKPKMRVKGIASTVDVDTDNEILETSGFQLDRLLKAGYFNYDHRARENPMYIVGEPDIAKITNQGLYVEGELYDTPLGKSIWEFGNLLKTQGSKRRLGFSIEGKALERDPLNQKRVTKALLTGIAITPSPKNSNSLMDVIKGEKRDMYADYEFELEKSIDGSEVILERIDEKNGVTYTIDRDLNIIKKSLDNKQDIVKSIQVLTIAMKGGELNVEQKIKLKNIMKKLH